MDTTAAVTQVPVSPDSLILPAVLIVFPAILAVLLRGVRAGSLRGLLVRFGALAVAAGSVWFAAGIIGRPPVSWALESPGLDHAAAAGGLLVSLYMLFACRRIVRNEWWIPVVIAAQSAVMVAVDLAAPRAERPLAVDQLGMVMVLIVGIVGGLICIYALPYMKDYHHHHPEIADRRPAFFSVMFLFLGGMFGVVFANHLGWMHFFWEITTVCSFLLIGYSDTPEARRNSFRALGLNAIGGLSFGIAILYQVRWSQTPTIEMDRLAAMGTAALVPAVLIGIAGMTKSAQMPFSSWLLGAMVAPTPVSALLHSSTMVKAGVFVILRFAPVFQGQLAGKLVALVGGVTFVAASLAAITRSNAKLVLAYSTIANLGLIVACAGVGSPEAVWAAILLIIFHAISKGLLFLTVGAIEHRTGSRDIEDMEGLLVTRRALGIVVLIGIVGMFLAPFGMLVAKWTCLRAFVDSNPLLAILLAYGSAPTLFFWTKWMGKVVSVPAGARQAPGPLTGDEWAALGTLAALTVGACGMFTVIATAVINPHLTSLYGPEVAVHPGSVWTLALMLGLLVLATVAFIFYPPRGARATRYMGGLNLSEGAFRGSLGGEQPVSLRNYYLTGFLHEGRIVAGGNVIAAALALAALVVVIR